MEQTICPFCGKKNIANAPFCGHCGESLLDVLNQFSKKSSLEDIDIPSPPSSNFEDNNGNTEDEKKPKIEIPSPIQPNTQTNTKINGNQKKIEKPQIETTKTAPTSHQNSSITSSDVLHYINQNINNPQKSYTNKSLFFIFLGALMVFSPSLFDISPMDGGGALIMIGLLIGITSVWVFFHFRKRAAILENMLNGKNLLSYFIYDKESYERQVKERLQERKTINSAMFNLIFIITLIICVVLLIASGFEEDMWITVGFMMGFMVVLKLISLVLPSSTQKKEEKSASIVLISLDGVWQGGYLHTWSAWRNKLKTVKLNTKTNQLIFTYTSPSGLYITRNLSVAVDIPNGEDEKATLILKTFNKK